MGHLVCLHVDNPLAHVGCGEEESIGLGDNYSEFKSIQPEGTGETYIQDTSL